MNAITSLEALDSLRATNYGHIVVNPDQEVTIPGYWLETANDPNSWGRHMWLHRDETEGTYSRLILVRE